MITQVYIVLYYMLYHDTNLSIPWRFCIDYKRESWM